jgi:UDP-glucose 4-epimerase
MTSDSARRRSLRIAVLGGSGFIGSAAVDRLLLDGHQLSVLARSGSLPHRTFAPSEALRWVEGDFHDDQALRAVLRGAELVLHLVTSTDPKRSNEDPCHDVQSNLLGSLRLLETMRASGVRRIVFVSSGGTVYGRPQYLPIDEVHPTEPQVAYGITKLAIEKFLLMYQQLHQIEPVILRVSNPYGERQPVHKAQGAIAVFLHRALNGEPIEIWGNGRTSRDYIYVSDVAEALAQAVKYTGEPRVMNISTGEGTSLNQLVRLIGQTTGLRLQVQYREPRAFDVPVSILDNTRARQVLQWAPRVSLKAGILSTTHWMATQKRDLHPV